MISSTLPLLRTQKGVEFKRENSAGRSRAVRIGNVGFLTFATSLSGLSGLWKSFESDAVCTPYQRYDWLRLWQRHIGEASCIKPLIGILSSDDGRIIAILPFGLHTRGLLRTASWLGDKHANYFMGLFDKNTDLQPFDCQLILSALAKQFRIDSFVLKNQPKSWQGFANPFAELPNQPSPSQAYSAALMSDYNAFYESRPTGRWKRQLRSKSAKLAKNGPVEVLHLTTSDTADEVLEIYFEQKCERLKKKGIPDPFSSDSVRGFFRALLNEQDDAQPLIEFYALTCSNEVLAIYAGSSFHGRFSASICSIANSPLQNFSPGEQLLAGLIEDRVKKGDQEIDLGIGEGRYKAHWCPDSDELFDTFLPTTRLGHISIGVASCKRRSKRFVKQNPEIWSLARRIRALTTRA